MILKDVKFKQIANQKGKDVSIKEGVQIATKLFKHLSDSKDGVGLAAPQIGILKNVCVINVKEPIALINPKIVKKSHELFTSTEGCLSFPKKQVTTKRYVYIIVKADNHESKLYFSANTDSRTDDLDNTLECACVQHEIDHLNGITMFDREVKIEPVKTEKQYGRNEKIVIINKDKNRTQKLKWKNAKPFIDSGDWELFTWVNEIMPK
tara:strand:+ start:12 stop:635 length:624 start_codon:yes stop_codon:yes gene_type:complete